MSEPCIVSVPLTTSESKAERVPRSSSEPLTASVPSLLSEPQVLSVMDERAVTTERTE
jgi:hypothetical protein